VRGGFRDPRLGGHGEEKSDECGQGCVGQGLPPEERASGVREHLV